jgi:2-methylcitrate dehydratase PrpD
MSLETEAENVEPLQDELAAFITETSLSDIPEETVDFAKHLTLKTTAGMVAGYGQPAGRKAARYVTENRTGNEEAGVIMGGYKTDVTDSVLANAVFAHASELEDDRIYPKEDVSWDITAIPTIFSIADKYMLSGREIVEAVAVGLEVHTRLGLVPNRDNSPATGQQGASAAAAATAAAGLDFDLDTTKNALGIAIGGG